jgi:hypothetical protein
VNKHKERDDKNVGTGRGTGPRHGDTTVSMSLDMGPQHIPPETPPRPFGGVAAHCANQAEAKQRHMSVSTGTTMHRTSIMKHVGAANLQSRSNK